MQSELTPPELNPAKGVVFGERIGYSKPGARIADWFDFLESKQGTA
jgi:hypothetical protein